MKPTTIWENSFGTLSSQNKQIQEKLEKIMDKEPCLLVNSTDISISFASNFIANLWLGMSLNGGDCERNPPKCPDHTGLGSFQ